MSMTIAQAGTEAKKWGALVRALSKIEEAADAVAGAENVLKEVNAQADKTRKEIVALKAEAEAAQAEVTAAKAGAKAAEQVGKDHAASLIEKAKDKVATMDAAASALTTKAQERVDALAAEEAALSLNVESLRAEHDRLTKDIAKIRSKVMTALEG